MKRAFYILLILLLVAGVFFFYWEGPGIKISITNLTETILKKIKIDYNGGQIFLPNLEPMKHEEFKIFPKGESQIEIQFSDYNNKRYKATIYTYLENDYIGSFKIQIVSLKKLNWQSEIYYFIFGIPSKLCPPEKRSSDIKPYLDYTISTSH